MKMFKKVFENKNLLMIFCGVLVGALLIVFGATKDSGVDKDEINEGSAKYSSEELESYTDSIEKKLKGHIEKIGGVSDVSVIVTIDGTNEAVYATDGSNKDYVVIKDSSGNESAVMLMEINANVRGIAVVCNYGNNEIIKQNIIEMLSSLFNIGANRISVMSSC